MDHATHKHMLESALKYVQELKEECAFYQTALPDPVAKYLLRSAKEHLAEHQKDLEALKSFKSKGDGEIK